MAYYCNELSRLGAIIHARIHNDNNYCHAFTRAVFHAFIGILTAQITYSGTISASAAIMCGFTIIDQSTPSPG